MTIIYNVRDLVGTDVSGWTANVTNPRYRDQYANGAKNWGGRIRKLTSIDVQHQGGKRWLYLRWERDTTDMSDCGYSGWREDQEGEPTVEVLSKPDAENL